MSPACKRLCTRCCYCANSTHAASAESHRCRDEVCPRGYKGRVNLHPEALAPVRCGACRTAAHRDHWSFDDQFSHLLVAHGFDVEKLAAYLDSGAEGDEGDGGVRFFRLAIERVRRDDPAWIPEAA